MRQHSRDIESWRAELFQIRDKMKLGYLNESQALDAAMELKIQWEDDLVNPTADILNAHLQICRNLEDAEPVLSHYKKSGTSANTTTYNVLISLAGSLKKAESFFEHITEGKLTPNVYTLNGLLAYCTDLVQAKKYLTLMEHYRIKPVIQTYNCLLKISSSNEETAEILKKIDQEGIQKNVVTYNTLISASKDYSTGQGHFLDMISNQMQPTINTFITLLKLAQWPNEVASCVQLFKKSCISPNRNWTTLLRTKQ